MEEFHWVFSIGSSIVLKRSSLLFAFSAVTKFWFLFCYLCFLSLLNIGLPLSLCVWLNSWGFSMNGGETDSRCSLFVLLKEKDGVLPLIMSVFHCSCAKHK